MTGGVEGAIQRGIVFYLAILASILLAAGCCLAPSEAVLRQLVESERSWCLMRVDWTGTLRLSGTGLRNGTVTCSHEHMRVMSNAPDGD